MPCVTSDVILEAEMVAFSDATGGIDGDRVLMFRIPPLTRYPEFWRIRSLVESTAIGPRYKVRKVHEQTPVM